MTIGGVMTIRETYDSAFRDECQSVYPEIDALEARLGYALDRTRLEGAARTLACPVKANPPNWQHGRVLYAVARKRLTSIAPDTASPLVILDIGTAKGFSALCLKWAQLDNGGERGVVVSIDVVDPMSRERRNSVAELDGLLNVMDFLSPWPEANDILFSTPRFYTPMLRTDDRIMVAFIDGKHTEAAVTKDAALVARHQEAGDVMVFDDLHIPGIAAAVSDLRGYDVEHIAILPNRAYAIATRC